MWIDVVKALILAQTQQEKEMTYFGLIFFGFFIFVILLDTLSKGRVFPSKGPVKKILLFFFVIIGLAILLVKYLFK